MEQRATLPLDETHLITHPAEMSRMVTALLSHPSHPVGFDIETTGLDPRNGHVVSMQFAQEGSPAYVVDVREQFIYDREYIGDTLSRLFAGGVLIVGHNLKFDFLWLMQHYAIYPKRCFDTMLAEQVIRGVGRSDAMAQKIELTLKALVSSYLGQTMSKSERNYFIDLDKRPDEWEAALPAEQIEYAAFDVRVLPELYARQVEMLSHFDLFRAAKLEMDALPAIASIEQSGVRVDVAGWRAFIQEKEAEAKEIESRALEVFGGAILAARTQQYDRKLAEYGAWERGLEEITQEAREAWEQSDKTLKWGEHKKTVVGGYRNQNPNPGRPKHDPSLPNLSSPSQLMQAFEQMGIVTASTSSDALKALEDDHPEVRLLLDYRRAQKFVTSFGEALLQYVSTDGRIHPEYQQIGASTGRMSCTRPNWQQVPSRGDGKKLRSLVIAEPGNVMLTADFSNIELRILADITGDTTMLRLFREGKDLHSETARMMFGLAPDLDVSHVLLPGSDQTYRAVAKTINFGLVYGMSPSKLARTINVEKARAEELMQTYFRLYPTVATWMDEQKHSGVTQLFSLTLSGRRRNYALPSDPRDPDYRMLRARVQRQAMNSPIQGTSADITKQALVNLYRSGILQNGLGYARIVAVVHDEIVLEAQEEFASISASILAETMGQAARQYLKRVTLPPVDVVTAAFWSKE